MSEAPRGVWDGVTPMEDYGDGTELVPLPVRTTKSGDSVVVRVGPVDNSVVMVALRGLPASSAAEGIAADDLGAAEETMRNWEEPGKQLAAAGLLAPPASFNGPEAGKLDWSTLVFADRMAIVNAIMRVSGWGAARTESARRFPGGDSRGGSNGNGAVAFGEPSAPAVVAPGS